MVRAADDQGISSTGNGRTGNGRSLSDTRVGCDLRTATATFATSGAYVNALGTAADSGSTAVRSAYGTNHQRWAELKRV